MEEDVIENIKFILLSYYVFKNLSYLKFLEKKKSS